MFSLCFKAKKLYNKDELYTKETRRAAKKFLRARKKRRDLQGILK
jgi:hypothetical protein